MKERVIIHLDMDAFFAAVEERENPQFRRKPVVVGAEPKEGRGRGVVSAANYQARKFGIHSAMPISQAYALCPQAIYLPPNFNLYNRISQNIMRILKEVVQFYGPNHGTVFIEQVSLDEAYIDVTESIRSTFLTIVRTMNREKELWERAKEIAERMRKEILRKEKLISSCGIGPNKMIAKIACEAAKPNGIVLVREGEAERFVEPLDVEKIPGVGGKTGAALKQSGFQKVGDLKKLSEQEVEKLFGKRGKEMYLRVRGIDHSPVLSEREVKSIGKETTFEKDTRDPELLIRTFERLVRELAKEAQEQQLSFKTITVVCRFAGFETHTKSKTSQKPTLEQGVFRTEAMKLFLRFLVEKKKPIRLIGVRAVVASGRKS